ncbi:GAF and ANTAR domain-containing protein [Haloechinothrix halophila]|uniref:GAF and ANTAR domain-containing protein n=1 Tax=Haloechinothrix halophila TaxID=1069073 RepID=UPI00041B0A0D|nr:GAF and ANTAR domain-containing protein [Haloechinothrix halophila]
MSEPDEGMGRSDDDVRAAVVSALRRESPDIDPLVRVCRACVALLPVDGASVSVMSGSQHRETLHASDAVMARLDSVQFTMGEGPCFEAFDERRPVLVPDLARDGAGSWPAFASEIADQQVGAVFAFPIQSGAITIGAMDMYRREPGLLNAGELATALRVVDLAAVAIVGASSGDGTDADVRDLAPLRRDRAEVHQATGMLISHLGVPPELALARLRGYAFGTGRLVEDVAREIVSRRLRLESIDI